MACVGTPNPCSGQPESTCEFCGCVWDWEFEFCMTGSPSPCITYTDPNDCEDCGCTWESLIKINIADVWKDASVIYINIGDVWKIANAIYINIGDVWKQVWP